jgi:hypothetical protein
VKPALDFKITVRADLAGFLRNPFVSNEQLMWMIEGVQRLAEDQLVLACKRIRIPIEDLTDTALALTAYHSVKVAPEARAGDLQACELFEACVDCLARQRLDQYGRDRIVLAFAGLEDNLKDKGRKFPPGRRPGSGSKVRLFVRRYLKTHRTASAIAVWDAIAAKPPKGVTVCDNSVGKYIETDGAPDTGYRRFANIVTEEKNRFVTG